MLRPFAALFCFAAAAGPAVPCSADEGTAAFVRGLNLNGPALRIDGRDWQGKDSPDYDCNGKTVEDQRVSLKPPVADEAKARMLRSSRWGTEVDVELKNLPEGTFQICLYVWEDNQGERYKVMLNGAEVLGGYNSGGAGEWKRLGPWSCRSTDGKIVLSARGGAANLSGVEIWSGEGTLPGPGGISFVRTPTPDQTAFFESRVRPVLAERCYSCHSATAKTLRGSLLLDSRAGVVKGGDSGPLIVPGDPDSSRLIAAIRRDDPDTAMPPKEKLKPDEVDALEEWVRMGAPDPRTEDTVASTTAKSAIDWDKAREWWSLRPLTSPPPPAVKDAAWPANPIDQFILARLEEKGLTPAPDAEKRALIRRATYDLTGLPPEPGETADFLADGSPEAFARVLDRLLASPRYGERWGRYWLDVVRYADTAGDNSDFPIPQMHLYRDWVIAAINRDLPYDQFVKQQIAGDLLNGQPEEKRDRLTATGYLANARRFGSRVDDYPWHLTIEDTLDNFGRAFLGLTVNCARCHDHKFDPISAKDYYALYGIFSSTRYPWPGIELEQKQRDFIPWTDEGAAAAFEKQKAEKQGPLDAEVKRLEKARDAASGDAKARLEKEVEQAKERALKNAQTVPPFETIYGVTDRAGADAAVQIKGDPARPGPVVERRFLQVLGGAALPPGEKSSGRRQLAEWLFERSNPLTPRVMANRIWLWHFGEGIVRTPNDFGKQGRAPTHPELLDWLASRFIENGWSIKSMHRLIMLSRTWRMAAVRSEASLSADPPNEYLSAFPRRRLDAEALRDTLLQLGGSLEFSAAGPHPFPPQTEWKFTQHNPFKEIYNSNHRSVYLMTPRMQRHPYLGIFDGADTSVSTGHRSTSTTPLQALFLLNDPLVHEQARRFAGRILSVQSDDSARIRTAWELLYGRPAEEEECRQSLDFLSAARSSLKNSGTPESELEAEAWQSLVRALFRLNEFVYPD